MEHSRRDFLKYVMALSATSAAINPLQVIAAAAASQQYLIVGSVKHAVCANLTKQTVKEIEIGFMAHSFLRHPKYPMRYLALEKWGTHAAVVDFDSEEVRQIVSGDQHRFYGHGCYVEEKKAFYVSRVSVETGKGYMVPYDPETYEPGEGILTTFGGLHECRRMADNTFAVTSSGMKADDYGDPRKGKRYTRSSLTFVDIISKGKVVRELTIDDNEQTIGHFEVTKHGQIIALTSPDRQFHGSDMRTASKHNSGYIYFSRDGIEPLRLMDWGKDLGRQIKGEILSVALNEDHTRAAVTNPMAGNVILIDMATQKVIKAIDAPFKGIVWDPITKGYLGTDKHLVWIDPDFKKMIRLPIEGKAGYVSSHSIIETV